MIKSVLGLTLQTSCLYRKCFVRESVYSCVLPTLDSMLQRAMPKRRRNISRSEQRNHRATRDKKHISRNPLTGKLAEPHQSIPAAPVRKSQEPPVDPCSENLNSLQSRIGSAIAQYESTNYENSSGKVDDEVCNDLKAFKISEFLPQLYEELSSRTVSQSIHDFPLAPKLLLHASKDIRVVLNVKSATRLCGCLLLYLRSDTSTPPSPGVSRAREWAKTILTNLIIDKSSDSNESILTGVQSYLDDGPRDILDSAKTRHIICTLSDRVRKAQSEGGNSALAVYHLCLGLAPVIELPELLDVVNALIVATGRMPVPLCSHLPFANEGFPQEFTDRLQPSIDKLALFHQLRLDSQVVMIRLCAKIREAETLRLRNIMNSPATALLMDFEDEQQEVCALASAAAEEVTIHWVLLGNLERDLVNETEPFSCRQWEDRHFMRAVLCGIELQITKIRNSAGTNARRLERASPLHRRYAPELRRLVTALAGFGDAVRPAATGLYAVCDALGDMLSCSGSEPDRPMHFAVGVHAVLLAMDVQLQVIFASAAMLLSQMDNSALVEETRIFHCISMIISAVDIVRMPGGRVALSQSARVARNEVIRVGLTELLKRSEPRRVACHSAQDPRFDIPDNLLAAICVGGRIALDFEARTGIYFLGELLRACEIVYRRSSIETSNALSLNALFESAVKMTLTAVANASSTTTQVSKEQIRERLLLRLERWRDKIYEDERGM